MIFGVAIVSMGTHKLLASDSDTSDTLAPVSITAIDDLRLRRIGMIGKPPLTFEVSWTEHPCPVFVPPQLGRVYLSDVKSWPGMQVICIPGCKWGWGQGQVMQ